MPSSSVRLPALSSLGAINSTLLALAVPFLACAARAAAGPSAADRAAMADLSTRVRGFVVWESNRSGSWELYRIETDGTGLRPLTDFRGSGKLLHFKGYLRPRVSPDGSTLLFAYALDRGKVQVWTVPADGGPATRLVEGNPLCWTEGGRAVLFVRDHRLRRFEIESGKESVVRNVRVPARGDKPSMVGDVRPDLSAAVFRTKKNEYVDLASGKTVKTTRGCEPQFTEDGRFLYWVRGPRNFRIWDIAADKERQLLGRPPSKPYDYTYFPTISTEGRVLTYGASPSQHSHSRSDYEVFVQELEDLAPKGRPVRFSFHPRTDRWPFLFVEGAAAARAAAPKDPADGMEADAGWAPAGWGNPVKVRAEPAEQDRTGRVLSLACRGGAGDKSAASRPFSLSPAPRRRARMEVLPAGEGAVRVALAVRLGEQGTYFESVRKEAAGGAWTRLEFDLSSRDWKSEASDWKHSAALPADARVREVILLVYNGKQDRTVRIDEFHFFEK